MKEVTNAGLRPQTNDDFLHAAHVMERMGGGFAGHIARAFYAADKENRERLKVAFPDLFTRYYNEYLREEVMR